MERHVLFVQIDRIVCYSIDDGAVVADRCWAVDHSVAMGGLPDSLSSYLCTLQHAEFCVLIDLPEEECHLDTLKTGSRSDRKHLIARLQNKRFAHALLSKTSVSGRGGNASILLSGVDKSDLCSALFELLRNRGYHLRAIHSPVTLMPVIAKYATSDTGSHLYVMPLQGCFRLIASVNAFVIFNRRIVVNGSDSEVAEALQQSLAETLIYLERLKQHEWTPPVLAFLGNLQDADGVKRALKATVDSGLAQSFCDLSSVTGSDGCLSSETLLLKSAFHCGNGYATKVHRNAYTRRKVRNACAALALCSLVGVASSMALANRLTEYHAQLAGTFSHRSVAQTDAIAEQFSHYDHSFEAVRQALVTARLIEVESSRVPMDFLNQLAAQVQRSPDVSVTSVQWEAESLLTADSLQEMLFQPDALQSDSPEKLPVGRIYNATVAGVASGSPDSALDTFESFVSMLRSENSRPSVTVVDTPFGLGNQDRTISQGSSDVSTNDQRLSGSAEISGGGFVLQITNQKSAGDALGGNRLANVGLER